MAPLALPNVHTTTRADGARALTHGAISVTYPLQAAGGARARGPRISQFRRRFFCRGRCGVYGHPATFGPHRPLPLPSPQVGAPSRRPAASGGTGGAGGRCGARGPQGKKGGWWGSPSRWRPRPGGERAASPQVGGAGRASRVLARCVRRGPWERWRVARAAGLGGWRRDRQSRAGQIAIGKTAGDGGGWPCAGGVALGLGPWPWDVAARWPPGARGGGWAWAWAALGVAAMADARRARARPSWPWRTAWAGLGRAWAWAWLGLGPPCAAMRGEVAASAALAMCELASA